MDTALIYARVSSKAKQGDNFSIPTQLNLMREEMEKQGYSVIELADMDSAFNEGLERPKLQEALEIARSGKIKIMMFFSSDRFTRDIGDGVILRRELKRYGVKLFFYYPTVTEITSEMELFHIINDWRSQQQIEIQRDKSLASLRSKAESGLYTQGLIAYGYTISGRRHDTTVVIHEDEARTIRRIFSEYLYNNIGCSELARRLNKDRVPTASGTSVWTERMVRVVLKRANMYAGVWHANSQKRIGKGKVVRRPEEEQIPVPVPAIITRDERDATFAKLGTRRAGRENKYNYLMARRTDCSCGRRNTIQTFGTGESNRLYKYNRSLSDQTVQGE
jgi:site-specific DNA recombinase